MGRKARQGYYIAQNLNTYFRTFVVAHRRIEDDLV
jgi:hypothetical protein